MSGPGEESARESIRDLAERTLTARDAEAMRRRRRVVEPLDATHVVIDGRRLVHFSGNDYLGLSRHPSIVAALAGANVAGSGSAALVTGRTASHDRAERTIAAWKGVDDAILLPSGYQANVAAIQTMAGLAESAGKRVRFLADKLVHASLIDAIRSTGAELRVYPHNTLDKLERLLASQTENTLDVVVTESIFSMDGDTADLAGIVGLRDRGAAFALIVDEAHASGLYGPRGAGLVAQLGLTSAVDLGIATFSKAAGAIGGAVYGPKAMVEAAVNFGRAYVYTTSPPACLADAIAASVDAMANADDRRARLRENISRFRLGLRAMGQAMMPGDSPIVPVIIGDAADALAVSKSLFDAGFLVVAVRPPTVPPGTSRLRVTLSSEHSREQIDALLLAIDDATR